MAFHGINVLGTQVPTDQVQLCFYDARQVMIADKRVLHFGIGRNRNLSIMVTTRGQSYGEGPAMFQSFKLRRTNAEQLYPMTPELKKGQDAVQRILDHIASPQARAAAEAMNRALNG